MESRTRKYLDILKIELDDLIQDIEFNKELMENRLKERKISEYVYNENMVLLKNEILGVEKIKKYLKETDSEITSLEDLRSKVEGYYKNKVRSSALPEVVFLLVNRKLDKIARYMTLDE